MFLLEGKVIYSPTDLAKAAECEFRLLRAFDVKLKRAEAIVVEDALMDRAALLGDAHERTVLNGYVKRFRDGVVELPSTNDYGSVEALEKARDITLDALRSKAPIVYQGAFFDGRFHGRSDFLELRSDGYAVLDTKLARRAKVTALLQLAGYADQLERYDIPLHGEVALILGNNETKHFALPELLAVYRHRRARMEHLLDTHLASTGPADWATTKACGRCEACDEQAQQSRDVLLVANLRLTQRAKLADLGITTVEQLADSTGPVPGIGSSTIASLRQQAKLQAEQDARPPLADGQPDVRELVIDEAPLLALPTPDPGDLFFDFEGDPLFDNGDGKGGLEYLFGVVESDTGDYKCWTADTREQEHQALREFLDYVADRRARFPNLRIYHYAAYERTALLRLAGYAEYGEDAVDDLLRYGVLVDLYATVRSAVRVGQPSYSIKKLEPLYMGDRRRDGVASGGDSVAEYARYCDLKETEPDTAQAILQEIIDYNTYDCLSTLELRNWLRGLVPEASHEPTPLRAAEAVEVTISDPLADSLRALAIDHPDSVPLRLLASSLGYHAREDKPFWREHFSRLRELLEDWSGTRNVFVVEEVLDDDGWRYEGTKLGRRRLVLAGAWGSGSVPGDKASPVFAAPVPDGLEVPADGCRATSGEAEITCATDEHGRDVVILDLALKKQQAPFDAIPVALVPGPPPKTTGIVAALRELGLAAETGALPQQPGVALLRRQLTPALPAPSGTLIESVTAAVRLRRGSYVAVQGPPGTGKTYLGARVVKELVAEGWKVGVVAQSHSVISHFLDACVEAGVPAAQVGKVIKGATGTWTPIEKDKHQKFLAAHEGCVVGGTVWDLVNLKRIQRDQLDLLVVDEAGQYCLANTLAASVSAKGLLLLGDPQQLPQVSQGTHAEPVNESALSWLMQGQATLPAEHGYFLPETWRMHPTLTSKVSFLSYDGKLESEPSVDAARRLDGLTPGLHVGAVAHVGNDTSSPEEAAVVVAWLQSLIGLRWTDKHGTRGLTAADMLVVAAYNAQVIEIRSHLAAAGLGDVLVGTVDKMQGREAPVVAVSLAASSAAEVPRGIDFLLSRNRLNVAISRAQWATLLVHSPALADHLPTKPEGVQLLGAFLGLQI